MVTTLVLDSFHTAHLDVAAGYGLLLCPRAEDDVWLGRESVYGAAWADVTTRLSSLGWAPQRDASGLLSYVGCTDDGQLVVEAQSWRGADEVDEDGWRALCEAAGMAADRVRPHPRA